MIVAALTLGLKYGPAAAAAVFSFLNHRHLKKQAARQAAQEQGKG
jgi:hypothetical protein